MDITLIRHEHFPELQTCLLVRALSQLIQVNAILCLILIDN